MVQAHRTTHVVLDVLDVHGDAHMLMRERERDNVFYNAIGWFLNGQELIVGGSMCL